MSEREDRHRAGPPPGSATTGPDAAAGPGGEAGPGNEAGPGAAQPVPVDVAAGDAAGGGPERPTAGRGARPRVGLAVLVTTVVLALVAGLFGGWAATRMTDDRNGPDRLSEAESFAGLVAAVRPSVVSIDTGAGQGSGVVLDNRRHVLTNYHVVADRTGELTVTAGDGQSYPAEVVGSDPRSDLAVLTVAGADSLTPATFGESSQVRTGDRVLAVGSPLGLEGTVTAGIVSAKNRTVQVGGETPDQPVPEVTSISGMLQTDAPINPGSSGGPLVNLRGEVIGINSAIATAGPGAGNIGVGFAIPADRAERVAERVLAGEEIDHPYLGVSVTDAAGGGALVQQVRSGSPADRAGLRPGDVIVAADGAPVSGADELVGVVQRSQVGERLRLRVVRDDAERTVTVTIGQPPDD